MSQSDFVTKGQALVNSGQYQEAVKVCRLGLLGRPTTVEGRVVLGQALLALKRYDEVLAEMRVALELDHGSFAAQLLKAEALLRKGDPHAAIEILRKLQHQAPSDPTIDNLLAECERNLGKPAISASHPSVSYLGKDSKQLDENTRHYPNHAFGGDADEETTGGSFDRPTAVAAPNSKAKRTAPRSAPVREVTPPPNVLAVGDKSGTVEVDPELEGIELDDGDDFGDIASPPSSRRGAASASLERGQVVRRGALPTPGLERNAMPRNASKKNRVEVSSVELLEDDLVEVEGSDSGESVETLSPAPIRKPGPGTRVRNAVNVPSGPLDISNPAANRPTAAAPAIAPPHLAQMIANAPHVMEVARPQPSMTMRGNAPGPIAAALPTMAAAQPPPPANIPFDRTALGLPGAALPQMPQQGMPPAPLPAAPYAAPNPVAAARPTLAINPATDGQAWARATVAAVPAQPMPGMQGMHPDYASPMAEEPTVRPQAGVPMDPQLAAMLDMVSPGQPAESSQSAARVLKTGMRKGRSKLQIAVWLVIGALVIAGGVIVGFKFRAMRLEKKIADTQGIAIGLAKSDTWKGMVRSRDRLAGIAQASSTTDNMAALARMRALIAFEFGEGVPEAKTAIDGLGGQGGLDGEIAAAYYALATNDTKAALESSSRALKMAPDDPAAMYVSGQAELLAGDLPAAIKLLDAAVAKEGRPLYRVALSRAYLEATDLAAASQAIEPPKIKAWYDAFDVDTTNELQASGIDLGAITIENPSVSIQRIRVAVASGQLGAKAAELRALLERIITEGGKAINDQQRGVSLVQVGFANLALSELDFALGRQPATAINAALGLNLDDQRFAEQATETLYLTLNFSGAATAAERTLKGWPSSRRARVALAQIALLQGRAQEAIELMAKVENADKLAVPLAIRGRARLALGDLTGAKEDLDRAYEKSGKKLEQALVARVWADLASGDIDGARSRLRKRFQTAPSPAVVTAWAAILRASGKADEIKEAKELLEPVAAGSPSVDLARAQLELARLARDQGDETAKALYTKVIAQTNSRETRVETARYLIDFSDENGGREMLDELLKGDPMDPPDLLIEAARARMLVGDHAGGAELLDRADKAGTKSFKYSRERGRLALRKGDYPGAVLLLEKALETSGDDRETLYLAAEVASVDPDKFKDLAAKVKTLAKERLKDGPAMMILTGKLLLKGEEAQKAYNGAEVAMQKAAPPRLRAQAALGLAVVAYNNQDDPVALNALQLAIRLDPTLYEAYIYMADIHIGRKELAKALERAQAAAKYNPDNVDAYVMIGRVAAAQGNRKLLNEMLTKVGAIAPNSEQLKTLQSLR